MIGPGGEKMARTACVINDLRHAAGRRGLGAVMGSKHLKAIAARGKTSIPVGDQEALQTLAKWMRDHWKEKSWGMHDLGTPGGIMDLQEAGQIPTRNFQDGQFEGAGEPSGEALRDTLLIDREGCFACPIRCKRVVKVDEPGMQVNPICGGPEYDDRRVRLELRRRRPEGREQVPRDLQRLLAGHHLDGDAGVLCHGVLREGPLVARGHRRAGLSTLATARRRWNSPR